MKAIILAAGRGRRMKNKTEALPKCLTVLWGKTLLEWQIEALHRAGIDEIGIVTGYRSDMIQGFGAHCFYNRRWAETNMVSSLFEANEWLEKDTCIVSYADIIYTDKAIKSLLKIKDIISLVYYTKFVELWKERFLDPLCDLESFRIDEEHYLTEIGKKVSRLDDIEGQYMGLMKFTPDGWNYTVTNLQHRSPKPIAMMDMTAVLNFLIQRNLRIRAVPYDGLWLEVDNPEDLSLYESWEQSRYQALLES